MTPEIAQRISDSKVGIENPKRWKSIKQFNKEEEIVNIYPNLKSAYDKTGILVTSINNNIMGRSKSAGGYIWKQV